LISLNRPNFVQAMKEAPASLKPSDADLQKVELEEAPNNVARTPLFLKQLERIHSMHSTTVDDADAQLKAISPNPTDKAGRYGYQVYHAKGDGLYRQAHLLAPTKDKEFAEYCDNAIKLLKQADMARPNHYAVLQSLARLYADPRYDPRGNHLETARDLYARSIELKASDFFGHQQLAALVVREAFLWGPEVVDAGRLAKAMEHAERARQLRPGSSATLIVSAQLYALSWLRSPPDARAKYEGLVEASLAAAADVNRYPERATMPVTFARLQWRFLKFRAANNDQDFKDAKPALQAVLKTSVELTKEDTLYWEASELHKLASELSKRLESIAYGNRFDLRWSHESLARQR
jgi:hypothetical protein